MILIAHRGNLTGVNPDKENSPEYIQDALDQGYHCEIDLRVSDGTLFLGHDAPQYAVTKDFLQHPSLWIHCKDSEALAYCLSNQLHCFWHEEDDYTLTSSKVVWAYPGKSAVNDSTVLVMPERHMKLNEITELNVFGICSDIVKEIRDARA